MKRKFMGLREDTTIFTNVSRNDYKSEVSNTIPLQEKEETHNRNGKLPTTNHGNHRNGKIVHSPAPSNGELTPLQSPIKSGENADVNVNSFDKRCRKADLEDAALIGEENGNIHVENNNNHLGKT